MRDYMTFSEDVLHDLEDEDAGVCVLCGEWAYNVEPDAREYECINCGHTSVYGPVELVIMGLIDFAEDGE